MRTMSRKAHENPIPDRTDWTRSTYSERLRYVLHSHFHGDRQAMGRLIMIPPDVLSDIDRGKRDATREHLSKVASRVKRFNGPWLRDGLGQPFYLPTLQIVTAANPDRAATTNHDATAGRLAQLLADVWGNDQERMAQAGGIAWGVLEEVLDGRAPVPDDLLEQLVAARPEINLDWLLTGEGPMLVELPPAPVPATTVPAILEPIRPAGLGIDPGLDVRAVHAGQNRLDGARAPGPIGRQPTPTPGAGALRSVGAGPPGLAGRRLPRPHRPVPRGGGRPDRGTDRRGRVGLPPPGDAVRGRPVQRASGPGHPSPRVRPQDARAASVRGLAGLSRFARLEPCGTP